MSRLRRTCRACLAVTAVLVLAGASGARAGEIAIRTTPTQVTAGLGERFSFQTTITNAGPGPSPFLIAHLNILSLRDGTYVDPEDWSGDRTVYLGSLPPGAPRTLTWKIHAVNTGSLAAYVTVLPQNNAGETPATGTVVQVQVSERDTLNAGGVLPLALAVPGALALLAVAARLARRRSVTASP